MPVYYYLLYFIIALALSTCLTPLARKMAFATGRVAKPKDSRWHKKETALLGGVGIFVSTLSAWLLGHRVLAWDSFHGLYVPILVCATAVFILGLIDDIVSMDPQHKLAAQIIITSVLVFLGLRLDWTFSKTFNLLLSVFWIVGITNAFSLGAPRYFNKIIRVIDINQLHSGNDFCIKNGLCFSFVVPGFFYFCFNRLDCGKICNQMYSEFYHFRLYSHYYLFV